MIWDFLNNSSIAAFVGAFSAFFLVVLTDWRRKKRYATLLKNLISDNRDHARFKIETVRGNIAMLREDNEVTGAPIMQFPTKAIRDYQFQVLDTLGANHKQALDALIYWMEAIDELLSEARATAYRLKEAIDSKAGNEKKARISQEYLSQMADAEKNLDHLIKLLGYYVADEPHKIIEFQHPVDGKT